MPVGSECEVFIQKYARHLERIGLDECSLEQRLGDFEADEIVISFGREVALGHLPHIEREFHFQVRSWIVTIRDRSAEFAAQLGKHKGDGSIGGPRMAGVVGGIMR